MDHYPQRPDTRDVKITDVSITGAEIQGGSLTKDAVLPPFSGVSLILKRTGRQKVAVVITFDTTASIQAELEAIPQPEPAETSVITKAIVAYGGWPCVRGDTEMDTGGGDRVPVVCTTKLGKTEQRVLLEIFFYCEEHGGDHTTYQGTQSFPVYEAPPGRKIAEWSVAGGAEKTFHSGTKGKNHEFNPFDVIGTYWKNFSFRVDGKGRDDDTRVGVGGELEFTVTLL